MSQRPRANLARVLDDLGDSFLELVAGDPAHEGEIGGIVIHDPDDEPVQPPTALVLGVGVPPSALPGFTLPGDISASDRFYRTDITAPLTISDGYMDVPNGPGLGVTPIPEILEQVTTSVERITL